jgi:hypothetical protein
MRPTFLLEPQAGQISPMYDLLSIEGVDSGTDSNLYSGGIRTTSSITLSLV